MTNGNKRDRSINKSTISTPPREEVQRRKKGASNDTINTQIDGQLQILQRESRTTQQSDDRQNKQPSKMNNMDDDTDKKVLISAEFLAGRIDGTKHAFRQLHPTAKNQAAWARGVVR